MFRIFFNLVFEHFFYFLLSVGRKRDRTKLLHAAYIHRRTEKTINRPATFFIQRKQANARQTPPRHHILHREPTATTQVTMPYSRLPSKAMRQMRRAMEVCDSRVRWCSGDVRQCEATLDMTTTLMMMMMVN